MSADGQGAAPPRDLGREIEAALADESLQKAVPHGAGTAAANRRRAIRGFAAYETARTRAREIKEAAIEDLPRLIDRLEAAVVASGGTLHRAADGDEACRIITAIAEEEAVESCVKSKSMTSEEIHLNSALAAAGVRVRETDLGEYIVQLDGDRPSHIIAPIIHKGLEEVRAAFRRELGTDDVPDDPEKLTQLARRLLRRDFLAADMGVTGANFLIADSGTVVLVENEGNGRLTTQVPRVHVALAGVEKIIPTLAELEPFLELLPRSATGQLMTCYLSFISGPGWDASPLIEGERVFHLVLLDNGRMKMRDDPVLREALYCIRCGACLNVCPPYNAVGGHVFGGPTYQSGIGVAWEAGVRGPETAAGFADLCSTCSRCHDVCPVRIDIPWMNSVVQERIAEHRGASAGLASRLLAEPGRMYRLARSGGAAGRWVSGLPPVRAVAQRWLGFDAARPLPDLAPQALSEWYESAGGRVVDSPSAARELAAQRGAGADRSSDRRVVFFADCHTEHVEVGAGRAALRVLHRLGFDVSVVTGPCCGRAALSQGQLGAARNQARALIGLVQPLRNAEIPLVGLEPSCLTCVAQDHAKLLPEVAPTPAARPPIRDVFEFLREHEARIHDALHDTGDEAPGVRRVVVHGHCQQRTAGWYESTLSLLLGLPGVEPRSTSAECCGMAGSYGYKELTYAVSRRLGERLIDEIRVIEEQVDGPVEEVLACGTSCRAQIGDCGGRKPRHPVQLLAEVLGCGST